MSFKGFPVAINPRRVGVLIGRRGETKKSIEELFKVKLTVDSKTATVYVMPDEGATPLHVMRAKQVIEAISIGFNPEDALLLSDERYLLEMVDLSDIARNRNDLQRIKARVIGEGGRARKTIEEMSGARIVVSDKVVGIIGEYENAEAARKAIEMLARGRTHAAVYSYLRSVSRDLKRKKLELWERGY